MRLRKRIMALGPVQAVTARLIALYIRLVHVTTRWDYVGLEHLRAVGDGGTPLIACFWHGRIMMTRFLWRQPAPFHMLISPHRDGLLIARAIRHLGIGTIAGSTTRDGTAALRTIIRTVKAGGSVGITPDGPRGPRMRAKGGVVAAARAARAPILPVAYGTRNRLQLGSWDRLLVPLPFGRGTYVIMPAVDAAALEPEAARRLVEERLNEATRLADLATGAVPIEPDPLPAAALP